jgi:hypothetical protein
LDRGRHGAVIAALASGEQSGLLALMLHRAVTSLTGGQAGAMGALQRRLLC